MDDQEKKMILAGITLFLEHGAPTAIRLIQTLSVFREPTLEEIEALKDIKDPGQYFNSHQGDSG